MPVDEGPTLRRRRLGAELKRCREAAGLTQEQVSRHFEWHTAKVTRIETARVAVTARDVKDLLLLYGVTTPDYCESLVALARSTRGKPWWWEYRDILRPDSYIPLEAEASAVRNWEPMIVPGLLQTEAYMRALFATSVSPDPQQARLERAVALRLARRRRLTDPAGPLTLSVIIDESVVHRRIGDGTVMTDQLRHLIAMSQLPNVTLQILPFSAGEHPLLGRSVAILEFAEAADLNVVYVEGFARTRQYRRQPAEVARYQQGFEQLASLSLDDRLSVKLIESLLPEA